MQMIVSLIRGRFHGPVARHWGFTGTDEGITIGPRHVFEVIFSKEPAIDLDAQAIGQLCDSNALGAGRRLGLSGANGDRETGHQEGACGDVGGRLSKHDETTLRNASLVVNPKPLILTMVEPRGFEPLTS